MRPIPLLFALATLPALGCYRYVPVPIDDVSAGDNLRARITAVASDSLPAAVRTDGRLLSGRFLDRDDGSVTLSVPAAVRQEGFYTESLHERVRLHSSDIVELQRRQLDRTRTFLVSGVGAAAVAAIAIQVLTGQTGGNTIDRSDQGPSASIARILVGRFP